VRLRIPASIQATWPEAVLAQAPLPAIDAPAGFDLAAFTAAALRAAGMRNPPICCWPDTVRTISPASAG
jgi:hypothetical protein